MTRSTLSPMRRFVAALALAGVAGLGGVAVAPAASAAPAASHGVQPWKDQWNDGQSGQRGQQGDDRSRRVPAAAAPAVPPAVPPLVVTLPVITGATNVPALATLLGRTPTAATVTSPLPEAPVAFVLGRFSRTLPAVKAQVAQTVLANLYVSQGFPVAFDSRGALVIGPRTCDPAKSTAWNKGCVAPTAGRF